MIPFDPMLLDPMRYSGIPEGRHRGGFNRMSPLRWREIEKFPEPADFD
jgi:hypothetical protein